MSERFEAVPIPDDARLECGICWHVYDPAEGDTHWQIAAGTPFSQLPDHWTCPECDAPRHKFMVLEAEPVAATAAEAAIEVEALVQAYRRAALGMRALPLYNPRLDVAAVGFRAVGEDLVGVVVTPWFMNLTVVPAAGTPRLTPGDTRRRRFAFGEFDFLGADLTGFGAVESCSLFSPMDMFEDQAAALATAEATVAALFEPEPVEQAPARVPAAPSRRAFLTGAGPGS